MNLFCLVLSLMITFGFATGMSALISPISKDFQVDRTTAATGINAMKGISFLATIVINFLMERKFLGPR